MRLKMVLRSLEISRVVSARSLRIGKVNEEIDTEQVTGDDLTISFNPPYLIDSLRL